MTSWAAVPTLAATDPFDKPVYDIVKGNLEYLLPLFARKTADESVTSSTALQNDDHLVLAAEASATYELEMLLSLLGAAAGDFKFQYALPAGSTMFARIIYFDPSLSLGNALYTNAAPWTAGTDPAFATPVHVVGTLRTGGTAGNLQLTWAQNASNATPTKVLADSYMRLRRVA